MNLHSLISMLRGAGATRVYYKTLAANDNTKNQYYIGSSLEALNVLPTGATSADVGTNGRAILKAPVDFAWLDDDGTPVPAPKAQVIFYPQYPEVRLSSLAVACPAAPRAELSSREPGRVLVLGTTPSGRVLARLLAPRDPARKELLARPTGSVLGVFTEFELDESPRAELLAALREVADRGWIPASRLSSDGAVLPCRGPNCGGLTLEAALGILPNSIAGPDYAGWEIKQHTVRNLERPSIGTLTLMTPEPDGGWYRDRGVVSFIRQFGYADTLGRPNRLNFGGRHSVLGPNERTSLKLELVGFCPDTGRISDATGSLALISPSGVIAASWSFSKLLNHWRKKHARAAYVPSLIQRGEACSYRYGHEVSLGTGTSFELLLAAIGTGAVFYDPGLKLEDAHTCKPVAKRRNQIRVGSRWLPALYESFESVDTRSV